MQTTNIFTYGSLMYPSVMYKLVQQPIYETQKVTLQGFSRRQVNNKVYPAIIPQPGATVNGIVYYNVTPSDRSILDLFQTQQYKPQQVNVHNQKGKIIKAIAYVYNHTLDNLAEYDWNEQVFQQQHQNSFAESHSKK